MRLFSSKTYDLRIGINFVHTSGMMRTLQKSTNSVLILENDLDLADSIRLVLEDTYQVYIIDDPSQLKPYIKKSPDRYIAFIEHYHDRVMFGTDCPWDEAEEVVRFLDLIEPLPFQERTRRSLLYHNAMRFLGLYERA